MNIKHKFIYIGLIIFFGLCIFLTFNRHSKSGIQNYHSEIWADKAGYYIYLPSTFIYNFKEEKLPAHIDENTGFGFKIDSLHNLIITKYTYGVALMQSPFFLIGHFLAEKLGYKPDGFSLIYNRMIDISAVFYMFFAFVFLYFFLNRYVSPKISFFTLCCLFLGTNIFYYSIFDTGMSHVYSFFLFSVFLFVSPSILHQNARGISFVFYGMLLGLIIMVRPINIIILPVFLIFNKIKIVDMDRIYLKILYMFMGFIILIVPQLLYWKLTYGHFIYDSYGNEGFSNRLSPRFLNVWFSTNNGLFIFNPLMILILWGMYFLNRDFKQIGIHIFLYFLFISYVFSSWYDPTYGCSYSSRPFVEFFSIFSLPLAFFIKEMEYSSIKKYLFMSVLFIFVVYNLKLMFSYDGCWYGGNWDWKELLTLIISKTR